MVIASHGEALKRLKALFQQDELSDLKPKWFIEESHAFDVIEELTRKLNPNLLVFGTLGYRAIKRLLLGQRGEPTIKKYKN